MSDLRSVPNFWTVSEFGGAEFNDMGDAVATFAMYYDECGSFVELWTDANGTVWTRSYDHGYREDDPEPFGSGPWTYDGDGEPVETTELCCEYCGEPGTADDPISSSVVSPPVSGYDVEMLTGHVRCANEAARQMVV